MLSDPSLKSHLTKPSISYGATNLYAHGIFEAETRPNLDKKISELIPASEAAPVLTVNDKKLNAPMRVQLKLVNNDMAS